MTETAPASDPLEVLRKTPPGTEVVLVLPTGERWQGWLMPGNPLSGPRTVTLKLSSGYNVGIPLPPGTRVDMPPGPLWGQDPARNGGAVSSKNGPEEITPGSVVILTTGGTIASRIDYATGGVTPVHGKQAFESIHPGLSREGPVHLREVFDILSEDVGPSHWQTLAEETAKAFRAGARGVVISHGTDTMAYTAGALAFQLRDLPGPVVLVGAQRSIDRPSSDGVSNLQSAVRVAREADLGEVVVLMHAEPSDGPMSIHRGTRVRKMHSTRRDAFETRNEPVLGRVDGGIVLSSDHRPRSAGPLRLEPGFDLHGSLVWIHPGLTEETIAAHVQNARGVVLAGTGMGHTPSGLLAWAGRATASGLVVAMTTQCLEGVVDPYVYSRGRELMAQGVVYLGDMLPETAFVKMLWSLHQAREPEAVKRLLTEVHAGERSDRRTLIPGASP